MPPPRLKRSNVAGRAPDSLEDGEIAVNQADGTVYYHTVNGGVAGISATGAPAAHTHGNITNAGAIGSTSGLPVITGASGVLTAGAFGTAAGTFCQGNDSRLSDARSPLSHTHTASAITDFATEAAKYGPVTSVNGSTGPVSIVGLTDGSKGDITVGSSGAAWSINAGAVVTASIATGAVTYAKMQSVSATDRLLGRFSSGPGAVEEIACTAAGRSLLDDADASAQRATLGLGSIATQAANAVAITGGSVNGAAIGGSSASTAAFTTLTTTGSVGVATATPAVALDVSGAVRASAGVLFGADTASANTLSDYEEGSWTPTFVGFVSNPTCAYHSQTSGAYTKIGRMVLATARVTLTACSGGGGALRIAGLPFASSSSPSVPPAAGAIALIRDWDTYAPDNAYIESGQSYIVLARRSSPAADELITTANLTATTKVIVTILYQT